MGNASAKPVEGSRLLLDGGGALPPAAMEIFKSWALENHSSSRTSRICSILIVPWASEREGGEHAADAAEWVSEEDSIKIVVAPTAKQVKESPDACAQVLLLIDAANAVFFTGGDQVRFMEVLDACPEVQSALTNQFKGGVGFGGTSAGTAVMSSVMITGEGANSTDPESAPWGFVDIEGRGHVATRRGLGFAPAGVVLDQHFTRRARFNRLLSVLLCEESAQVGLGVEEDTAVVIEGGRSIRVFSSKPNLSATLIKKCEDFQESNRFTLQLMPAGTGAIWQL